MLMCCVSFESVGCAKCSSVGINFVPSYESAYRRAGTAEKARMEALGAEVLGSTEGRKQRRLALCPASRAIDAAITIKGQNELDNW